MKMSNKVFVSGIAGVVLSFAGAQAFADVATTEVTCGIYPKVTAVNTAPKSAARSRDVNRLLRNAGVCKAALANNLSGIENYGGLPLDAQLVALGQNGGIVTLLTNELRSIPAAEFDAIVHSVQDVEICPENPTRGSCETIEEVFGWYGITVETGLVPLNMLWKLKFLRLAVENAVPTHVLGFDDELNYVVEAYLDTETFYNFEVFGGAQVWYTFDVLPEFVAFPQ